MRSLSYIRLTRAGGNLIFCMRVNGVPVCPQALYYKDPTSFVDETLWELGDMPC